MKVTTLHIPTWFGNYVIGGKSDLLMHRTIPDPYVPPPKKRKPSIFRLISRWLEPT